MMAGHPRTCSSRVRRCRHAGAGEVDVDPLIFAITGLTPSNVHLHADQQGRGIEGRQIACAVVGRGGHIIPAHALHLRLGNASAQCHPLRRFLRSIQTVGEIREVPESQTLPARVGDQRRFGVSGIIGALAVEKIRLR